MNESELCSIGQQLEMRDALFISRSSLMIRLVHQVADAVHFIFGFPLDSNFKRVYRAKKWINSCLQNYAQLLKQLVNIRKARDDFTRMRTDVLQDKDNLATKMKEIHKALVEMRSIYLSLQSEKLPTTTFQSDITLVVSDYERYSSLYSLYNDILSLINKTLVETERIEKLANLCGAINNSSFFSEPVMANDSLEDTLFELLGYVARCDRTKDYITSQLSIAKSTNVDDAIKMGTTSESLHLQNVVEGFVESGDISILDARQKILQRHPSMVDVESDDINKMKKHQVCPA